MNIEREYKEVMTMLVPIRKIEAEDHEKIDLTTNNYPIRLIVGGKAGFVRLASSCYAALSGKLVCRPRVRIFARLWIRWKFKFAKLDTMDDVRPRAIIKAVTLLQRLDKDGYDN